MSDETFTDTEIDVLVDIALSLSIASFIGSAFICISSALSPKLRTFAFNLIVALAISNIGMDIGYFLGHSLDSDSIRCKIQGIMQVYFALVGFLLISAITLTCYHMVVKQDFTLSERSKRIMICCWGIPLPFALLPLTTSSYGDSGAWCSIVEVDDNDYTGLFWRFSILYVPLWFTIGVNIWMHIMVSEHLRRLELAAQTASSEHIGLIQGQSRTLKVIVRLRMYPFILCICWSFASVNRIYEVLSTSSPQFWLYILQYTLQTLNGVLYALAFAMTPSVQREWLHQFQHLLAMLKSLDSDHRRSGGNFERTSETATLIGSGKKPE